MPEMKKYEIVLNNGSVVSIHDLVKRSNFGPEHLVEILTETYNTFSASARFDAKVAEALTESHRTLQQSIIRGLVQILIEMGKKSWGTDPRNEAGITLCKRLERLVEEEKIFLPFV